jgi:molybdopterin synthase sulfur carrier subunit
VKIRYFAWVRERIGRSEEEVEPPATVATAGELVLWLKSRDERSDHAFERPEVIRIAIDQLHVKPDTPIAGAREIAFFPPMTGG